MINNRMNTQNGELLSTRWKACIYCFQLIGKKSKEHIVPESIGGKLEFPFICRKCNNDLGGFVDSHWTWDCWMKFAKEQLSLQKFNFKSDIEVTDLQNKYTITTLPDGKEQNNYPLTQPRAWRAIAKMAYEWCAMMIGSYIFHGDFDKMRNFITRGELPVGQECGPISICLGEWLNIVRTSFNKKPAPWHIFDFQDVGESLSIHLALFNYYSFLATFKVNIKALGVKTVELPFRVVQELRPENKLYFCNWDNEQDKWKIISYF